MFGLSYDSIERYAKYFYKLSNKLCVRVLWFVARYKVVVLLWRFRSFRSMKEYCVRVFKFVKVCGEVFYNFCVRVFKFVKVYSEVFYNFCVRVFKFVKAYREDNFCVRVFKFVRVYREGWMKICRRFLRRRLMTLPLKNLYKPNTSGSTISRTSSTRSLPQFNHVIYTKNTFLVSASST